MKNKQVKSKSKIGKLSRAQGKRFENEVRKDLENRGWIISKWSNIVEFKEGEGKLIQCRSKFNPFTKSLMMGSGGFPDFICFRLIGDVYSIIGVESKMSKYLDAKEKQMCSWLLDNKIFPEILIAYQEKEGRKNKIVYKKFII